MTDRATLEALLARVLEGTEPDRELNAGIAVMVGGWRRKWHDSERPHGWYWRRGDYSWTAEMDGYPSDYLGSLDAALTLVPEGWNWEIYSDGIALLWKQPPEHLSIRRTVTAPRCATPARALIAACIEARMEALGE